MTLIAKVNSKQFVMLARCIRQDHNALQSLQALCCWIYPAEEVEDISCSSSIVLPVLSLYYKVNEMIAIWNCGVMFTMGLEVTAFKVLFMFLSLHECRLDSMSLTILVKKNWCNLCLWYKLNCANSQSNSQMASLMHTNIRVQGSNHWR